jgi:guanosine-3',5'-bis(diphosphate) 3'-pyrophosphohydrolase
MADQALPTLIEKVRAREPDARADLIEKAFAFSDKALGGKLRLSGDPLSSHLLAVADILVDLHMDETTIVAALLHEAARYAAVDMAELRAEFGGEVADLVESLNRILTVQYASGGAGQAENFRRLILSMARDVRVVMIKLADQLHNMRTLDAVRPENRQSAARETLDVYAPLANRLGIHRLKSELEDLGLRYTEPDVYADLLARAGRDESEMTAYIAEVRGTLQSLLDEQGLKGDVHGRLKHLYSIYKKMMDQVIPFEKVYDRIAFRVIVERLRDCYAILGAVHARWTPVPGRFKDYIALPKPNLYQSLHTTVIGPRGEPMEVQIRTHDMHRIAEEGIAAHWRYKERRASDVHADKIFHWLRHLVESNREDADAGEFVADVKDELFPDVVYVFTPQGKVLELPRGSTPVDFAFNVHSQLGNQCVGARVNGRMVALDHTLKNGDRVEIITSKTHTPSADWLEFVKSSKARNRIRQWIRQEQRERSMALGREMLDREYRKVGKSFPKDMKEGLLDGILDRFGVNKAEEILEGVGMGKINARTVLEKVHPEFEPAAEVEEVKRPRKVKPEKKGIVIRGVGDTMVRYAKCCNPLPGDPVVGFITRGFGLTVHTASCPNLIRSDPNRHVDVEWGAESERAHPVRIKIVSDDRPGILANITQTFANHDVNVVSATVKTFMVGKAECNFEILVDHLDRLQKILGAIRGLKGVDKVIRVRT